MRKQCVPLEFVCERSCLNELFLILLLLLLEFSPFRVFHVSVAHLVVAAYELIVQHPNVELRRLGNLKNFIERLLPLGPFEDGSAAIGVLGFVEELMAKLLDSISFVDQPMCLSDSMRI